MPLLHHPLTVEGQRGPPLSAGPAALIWTEMGWGGSGVGIGERRGWTHSLLLITDQNIDSY